MFYIQKRTYEDVVIDLEDERVRSPNCSINETDQRQQEWHVFNTLCFYHCNLLINNNNNNNSINQSINQLETKILIKEIKRDLQWPMKEMHT